MSPRRSCCVFSEAAMLRASEVACSDCELDPMCQALDYAAADSGVPEGILLRRRQVNAGELLFESGQPFDAIYAVKSGSFKGVVSGSEAGDRVVGFYFAGELVGAEGMAEQHYDSTVRALEASQVCVLYLDRLDQAGRPRQALQNALIHMLGKEVALNQRLVAALVRQSAEQRVAAFLVSLADRLKCHGFSPNCLVLPMSRSDIGSYLGLARETISRLLTRFQQQDLIRLHNKRLYMLDDDRLRLIASGD